jgi:hypothetical protein
MSTTTTDFTVIVANAQKQTLTSIKRAQDASLEAARATVGLVSGGTVPALPSPRAAVESTFAFYGEVLDLQRQYALELTDIVTEGVTNLTKKGAETAQK